jgi:tetratricopeptide (TPR) repeat protein
VIVRGLALLLLLLAGPALAHGPFHERIAAANERVARQPGNPEALVARGELFREHGDYDLALADFAEAARVAPATDVDLLRGRTLLDAGRAHQALVHLDRWLARHPDGAAGFVERARAHEVVAARAEAADDYQRAVELTPRPSPDEYLRRMRLQLAAGRPEAALGGLDEGIGRLGPIVSLEQPAIELELAGRRWEEALLRLEKLAAQSPRKESFLERRGQILLQAGRRAEARQAFRAALDAIAALPPAQRETPAIAELRARLRKELATRASPRASPPVAGGSSRPRDR